MSYLLNIVKVGCHGHRMWRYINGIQIWVISGTIVLIFMYTIVDYLMSQHQIAKTKGTNVNFVIYKNEPQ